MRTSTVIATSTLLLIILAGCTSNSGMVERFDPTPKATPGSDQPSANALPTSNSQPRTAAKYDASANAPAGQPPLRTGPVTAEWIAQMEATGNRSGVPTIKNASKTPEKEPFDRSTLVFTAGTDQETAADAADGLTQVTFAAEGADFDPRVSRDGQSLVFASTQHRATADIYIKKIGGRAITQLTNDPGNDVMPALSPDGKRIAFASDRNGTWQLFVMGVSGGRAVQLSGDGACDLHPTWSPDGRKLAFCRLGQTTGRWEMWVIDASNPSTAEFIGYGMFPVWCPVAKTGEDGADKIAFQRGKERGDRAFGLWTVDYKPGYVSSPTQIVSATSGAAINPNWSPDGQYITYATVKSGQSTAAGVWIVAADGSVNVNLTSGPSSDMSPWWGKDGRVYFVSDRSGHDNIWSVGTERAMAALVRDPAGNQPVASSGNGMNSPSPAATANTPADGSTANVPTNP